MREHSRRPRGEKGARAGRGLSTDTGGGRGRRFAEIKRHTHQIGCYRRPRQQAARSSQVPYRPHSPVTQCPAGQPSEPRHAAEAAGGCGPAERGVTTELAASIGPSGAPEYAPPVRQRAVRRSRRAGGAPSVRRRSRRVGGAPGRPRPTSDEEIRHAVEGRSGSRAPAKRATSFHGERARAACVITCQK